MNTEAKKPIDLSLIPWVEAATGGPLLEYLLGGNVEALRSGESSPTDQQTEILAALSTLRQKIPKELEESNIREVVQGWLTQIGSDGKSVARSMHEHVTGIEKPEPARDDLEAALVALALDSYPAYLLPSDPLLFPVPIPMDNPNHHVTSALDRHRHPQAIAFFEAALRDPVLKEVFKEEVKHVGRVANVFRNTGSGSWVRLSMLAGMVLRSSWRHLEGANLTPTTFATRAVQELRLVRDVLAGKSRKIPVKLAFTGVLLPLGARVELPDGAVRPVTEADRRLAPDSLKTQLSGTDSTGQSVLINYDGDVLLEYDFPYRVRVAQLVSEGAPEWPQDMRSPAALDQAVLRLRFSLMLAVERETRVQIVPTWRYYDDPLTVGMGLSWSDPRQTPGLVPTQLTEAEVESWHEWYGRLITPHIANIDLALNRIMRAMAERREPSDVLIDSVIAWENLFGSSAPTLRVTACLARLLEESADQRKTLRTRLAQIYTLRSKIVHGSTTLKERDYPTCQEALGIAIRAVRVLTTTRTDILQLRDGTARSEALLLEN